MLKQDKDGNTQFIAEDKLTCKSLKAEETWKILCANNSDPFGHLFIIEAAANVGQKLDEGKSPEEAAAGIFNDNYDEPKLADCHVVSIITCLHLRGKEFRIWFDAKCLDNGLAFLVNAKSPVWEVIKLTHLEHKEISYSPDTNEYLEKIYKEKYEPKYEN